MGTLFTDVYNRFFGKITDDMYLELTPEDTLRDARQLLIDAIPNFEFPRKSLAYVLDDMLPDDPCFRDEIIDGGSLDYVNNHYAVPDGGNIDDPNGGEGSCHCPVLIHDSSAFVEELSDEEINILALLMMCAWVQRQITSIENTRMKYSGPDFKMTSQANHLSKLLSLLAECQRQEHHMQRLYKRRKYDNGVVKSNWSIFRKSYDN